MNIVPYEKMDSVGNELKVGETGQITLALRRESFKIRKIGQLIATPEGQLVYEKHVNEERHLFRKYNAWGFHNAVLEYLDDKAWLRVVSDKRRYAIRVKDAKMVAQFNPTSSDGFEKQAFVPLTYFKVAGLNKNA